MEQQIREIINSAKGQFFSGMYIKKDGSERVFNGKELSYKHLAGGESTLAKGQIAYFDINANGWRSFYSDQLKQINVSGETYSF